MMQLVGSFSRWLWTERLEITYLSAIPMRRPMSQPSELLDCRLPQHKSNPPKKEGGVLNIRRGQAVGRGLLSTPELGFGPLAFGH